MVLCRGSCGLAWQVSAAGTDTLLLLHPAPSLSPIFPGRRGKGKASPTPHQRNSLHQTPKLLLSMREFSQAIQTQESGRGHQWAFWFHAKPGYAGLL